MSVLTASVAWAQGTGAGEGGEHSIEPLSCVALGSSVPSLALLALLSLAGRGGGGAGGGVGGGVGFAPKTIAPN